MNFNDFPVQNPSCLQGAANEGMGKKSGRLLTSHRYNRLSLLHSYPGEVQQELAV